MHTVKKYMRNLQRYLHLCIALCLFFGGGLYLLYTKTDFPARIQAFIAEQTTAINPPAKTTNATLPQSNASHQAQQDPFRFTSSTRDFSLYKVGQSQPGEPTLLVVGGIQGDEPGGFSAATLLATHYTIRSGALWVVPDLNFSSILERKRGKTGDMNRKFASIKENDPQFEAIMRIKSIILDERVTTILNLHDGKGFYHPTHESSLRNPKRWGHCIIIDQEAIPVPKYGNLFEFARKASEYINKFLLDEDHSYHIRNTNTSLGDAEMEKTLTYFAICNGKPAYGIESSKEFSVEERTYYILLAVESFMHQLGIAFTRDFPLTPEGIHETLHSNLAISAYADKLILPLDDPRPTLNQIPFKKGEEPDSKATKPLLALIKDKSSWRVAYGNKTLTRISPVFLDFDDSLTELTVYIDETPKTIGFGDIVNATTSLMVTVPQGYRVNAIGAKKEKNNTEADIPLYKKDFSPQFSLDKNGNTFRIEVYKDKAFAGMFLIHFIDAAKQTDARTQTPRTPNRSVRGNTAQASTSAAKNATMPARGTPTPPQQSQSQAAEPHKIDTHPSTVVPPTPHRSANRPPHANQPTDIPKTPHRNAKNNMTDMAAMAPKQENNKQ